MARWREDGSIEFLGRKDRQIKLNGHRIELGEIENCLLKHPSIKEAVVVPVVIHGNLSLCAYYLHEDIGKTLLDLENYLKQMIPNYMIPNMFVPVEEIPMTIGGKVDIAKLPKPEEVLVLDQEKKPLSNEEMKISKIWTSVLGIPNIGVNQNFFELGGQSLKVLLLAEKLQKEGYSLNTMDLYKYPTISSFLEFQQNG